MNDIPNDILIEICSYCEYIESSLDGIPNERMKTYTPHHNYANELSIIIYPPKSTLLPTNSYILTDIIFPFRGRHCDDRDYYAGIQLFDNKNNKPPGGGKLIYKSDVMNSHDITDKSERMCKLNNINIELKCSKSL